MREGDYMTEINSAKKAIIEIKDMSKSYVMGEVTVHALKDVSLTVEPGQVTVILGPSGCGKTTLLNQIGGIDSPTKGSIKVNGYDIAQMNQRQLTKYRQEKIGFVFQFFNLIPNLTAKENVEFVLEYVMNLPSNEVHSKAQELLTKVGLGTQGNHFSYQMSGGEQQRVAIARALAKNPRILLADEPTGELDYMTGKMILELLTSLAGEGRAVLLVTHNKELAKIARKVIYLRDGEILKVKHNPTPTKVSQLEW